MAGRLAEDHEPDSEGSTQQGAARSPRAEGKHTMAMRQEKGHREELVRRQPWCTTSRRIAVTQERQGASRTTGLSPRPLSPAERSEGKHAPSAKTGGGHRPVDPGLRRGTELGKALGCCRGDQMPGGTGDRNSPGQQEAAGEANGLSSRPEKPLFGSEPRGQSRRPGTAVASRLDLQKGGLTAGKAL